MDQARHYLTQFTGPESYALFYFMLLGCGIGFPLNSDFVLISASVLAALGYFKLSLLLPIAFLGLLSGDTINFFIARNYGKKILKQAPFRWILSEEKVADAEKYLQEKGNAFIFCVRFLPLIRTVLYFTAGSLQIKPRMFYLLNGASTLIYLFGLMNAAFYAGENIDQLIATFKQAQFTFLGLFALVFFTFFIRKKIKRPATS
jgi:membrane-associated protein